MRKFYFKQMLTTLLLLCSSAVSAASFIVDGIAYNKKSSTEVEVTSGGTYTGDIVIPNTVTYNDVSYNVTSIGSDAFYRCSGLASVTIGNNVTTIGNYAFDGCSGLASVTIGNSVKTIGNNAFRGCTGLAEITIPDSVTTIGNYAFDGCSGLTSVTIGNSVTNIGAYAFESCSAINEILIGDLSAWCKISFSNAYSNPLLYAGSLYINGEVITNLIIPNDITEIKNYAFINCQTATSLKIHKGVTKIGSTAFQSCILLADITIEEGVTNIGDYAFIDCRNLTSITIPSSVTTIGSNAFEKCTNLTNITFGDGLTTIGEFAFNGCTTLTSITIGNSPINAKWCAFNNCKIKEVHIKNLSTWCNTNFTPEYAHPLSEGATLYLNGSIIRGTLTLPEDITNIATYAFGNCSGIRKVIIPDNVKSIGHYAFKNCNNITNVIVGDSVTYIGGRVFENCTSLKEITIGNSVKTIENYAFYKCTGITSIVIPNSVTSIGSETFYNCTSLTNIVIGDGVTKIGDFAFKKCTALESVTMGNSITTIGNYAFADCNAIKEVHIKDLSAWCKIGFPTNESNPLYFAGNLYLNGELINDIVIPDEITEIKDRTFLNCKTATNLKIHNGVTKIGVAAFENCSNLKGKLTIPESVTNIGLAAFKDCTGLKMITIPNSVDIIGERAFEDCLGTLCVNCDIPDITTSSKDWFYSSKFSTVILGDKVRNIGKYAFYNNTNLQEVIFGNSVEVVSFNAFENCKRLKAISLPPSVQYIDDYAFRGCDSITYVMSSSFTPAEVYNDIFSDATYSNATLYVPYGAKETYQETDYWNKFANISEHFLYRKQIFDIEEIAIDIIAQPINYLDRFLADADIDGFTDVNDIVSAVNFMLEDETPASAPKKLAERSNSGECALYIEPFEICAGEKKEVEILMNNEGAGITALQFDLYLPAGFEIVNSDSVYSVALGDRTTGEQHVVPVVGKQEDGALRVLTYSLKNTLFSGTEGDVITITLQASDDVGEGEYNIKMENVVIAGPDAKKILPANSNAVITIVSEGAGNDSMSGDMDGDGIVDVADVTKVVSMILDESQSSDTGDVNGDGIVDVADITKVISVILGSDTANAALAKAAATRAGATSTVSAEIENNELFVNITNPTFAFSAIQFDIVLPEGIEVDFDGEYYAVDLGSRTNNRRHSYPECAIQPDGSLRVVIVSMSNALYNGTEGDVAVASLKVDGLTDGRYEYGIKNVTIANEKSQKEVLEAYTAELIVANGVTGIGSIDAEGTAADGAIYDLAGRKVNSTVKGGIYIQNGKKFVAE